MKKIIASILSFLIIWSAIGCISISSANMPVLSIDGGEVLVGEEIALPIKLSENTGIAGLAVSLKYDEDVLDLLAVDGGTLFSGFTYEKQLAWDESKNVNENGVLATLHFKVSE